MNRRGFLRTLLAAPIVASLPWQSIASAIEPALPGLAGKIRITVAELVTEALENNRAALLANITATNELMKRMSGISDYVK
jgi:hypothetical protein